MSSGSWSSKFELPETDLEAPDEDGRKENSGHTSPLFIEPHKSPLPAIQLPPLVSQENYMT